MAPTVSTTCARYKAAEPLLLLEKMETFLETTLTQRARYLQLHKDIPFDSILFEADTKDLLGNLMNEYKSWMVNENSTSMRHCLTVLSWELASELIKCDEVRSPASCFMSLAASAFFWLALGIRFTALHSL